MLKMQKVPIVGGGTPPSPRSGASRRRIVDTDFLFSKVGRYALIVFHCLSVLYKSGNEIFDPFYGCFCFAGYVLISPKYFKSRENKKISSKTVTVSAQYCFRNTGKKYR